MKRLLLILTLLTMMLAISQTADAHRRIRLRKKAPVEQNIIRKMELKAFAPFLFGADSVVMDSPLLTMEEMGISGGAMIYICTLPEVKVPAMLTLSDCRDFAQVFVDDEYIGQIDRTKNENTIELPPVHDGQELKIIVEAMGRGDEGKSAADFVGLAGLVTLIADIDGNELTLNLRRWTILPIRDDYDTAVKALAAVQITDDPQSSDDLLSTDDDLLPTDESPQLSGEVATSYKSGYYRFDVMFSRNGDIYLNMGDFVKGQVFVNGNSLGHFSNSGSKQTLQVLRRYLKRGFNEVVVLDLGPISGEKSPTLQAQDKP